MSGFALKIFLASLITMQLQTLPKEGDTATPVNVELVMTFPNEYQYIKDSVTRSIEEIDAPFAPPFLVRKEDLGEPEVLDAYSLQQKITLQIIPQTIGNATLLINGQFKRPDDRKLTAFAPPQTMSIHSAKVSPPLLPEVYIPRKTSRELEINYQLLEEENAKYAGEEHRLATKESLERKSTHWQQWLLGLLAACMMAWWMRQRKQWQINKGDIYPVLTRYGILMHMQELSARQPVDIIRYYQELETNLRHYYQLPQSLTVEESVDVASSRNHLSTEQSTALNTLLKRCQQSKFSPPTSAIYDIEETLKQLKICFE